MNWGSEVATVEVARVPACAGMTGRGGRNGGEGAGMTERGAGMTDGAWMRLR